MTVNTPLTLTLPSDLALLPVVRSFVEEVCRTGGLARATTDAIVLATNEATSNVIRHAHRNRPDVILHVQCTLLEGGVEVALLDQGEPFNVAQVPNLDPSEMRIGGRGVFLMRALMDEVVCCPRETGGNTLRMFKRCDAAEAAADSA